MALMEATSTWLSDLMKDLTIDDFHTCKADGYLTQSAIEAVFPPLEFSHGQG